MNSEKRKIEKTKRKKLIKMDSVETSIKKLCAEIDNQMQSSIIFNLPDPPKVPPTPRTDKIEIFFFVVYFLSSNCFIFLSWRLLAEELIRYF